MAGAGRPGVVVGGDEVSGARRMASGAGWLGAEDEVDWRLRVCPGGIPRRIWLGGGGEGQSS